MKINILFNIFILLIVSSVTSAQSNIGNWSKDEVGLPIFNYTGDIPYVIYANDGTRITYPEDPWFLLGNYGITSFVHTTGTYDLYTLRRAWGRLNAETKESNSSSAKIKVDGKEYTISGLDSDIADKSTKVFGTGFAKFNLKINKDISCERLISIAPSKDINTGNGAMLITISIKNNGTKSHSISYIETVLSNYNMIDEKRISYKPQVIINKDFIETFFTPEVDKSISVVSKERASTFDFYPATLFIKGEKSTKYSSSKTKEGKITISALKSFKLKAGETKTLSFVVGAKYDDEDIIEMSSVIFQKGKKDPAFRKLWKEKLPDCSFIEDDVTRREQYWNTYVLEASAKYNTYFDETFIPQGMTYDYVWGLNAVARDHLHYSLSANYFNPMLSKSIIRFVLKLMNPEGFYQYNVNGYGYSVPNLWSPSDIQLHLLWAVAEYLNTTSNYSFLKEETVFYPKRTNYSASVIDKLTIAFDYLNDEIRTGPHGLTRMLNADWNDQIWNDQPITIYYNTAESHYNSSMSIVVMKELLIALNKAVKDSELEKEKTAINSLIHKISIYREKQLKAFIKDFGDRDFVKRAYYDETLSMGDKEMHIESQLYTLKIDEIPLNRRIRIKNQITSKLANNEVLGVRTSEKEVSKVFEPGTHENGGIWQYVQGMYALGLLDVDEKEADKVIYKMSFQNFAKNYPDYWPGQWSGADVVSSHIAKYPGLVSNNGSVYMNFPVYCTHIHSWPVLYQYKKKELNKK